MQQSLDGLSAGVVRSRQRARRLLAVVLAGIVAASGGVAAQCGNGVPDAGEECDDGGTCIGGANAGMHCTGESDCVGAGVCVGGMRARTACDSDAACLGGTCVHCLPQGGDGCAANCTFEHDVPFQLVPGQLNGLNLLSGTSGLAIDSDFLSIPLPIGGACNGGENFTRQCDVDADCPGGKCTLPQQTLTVGQARDGKIPVVVKAASVKIPGIPPDTAGPCICIRGVAAKTCGGAFFESDGMTRSTDCTPGLTAGDSVCSAAGKPPCSFVYGMGNSASGEIGCDGLDGVNLSYAQDSAGDTGGPPIVSLSGSGGPGSAVFFVSFSVIGALGLCTGTDISTYGPDGVYCTDDDPPGGIIALDVTLPAVTGEATAVVHNANGSNQDLGPVTVSGAPFSCSALAQGSAAGGGLVQAITFVHLDTVGDIVLTSQFFGQQPTPGPNDCCQCPTFCAAPVNGVCGGCTAVFDATCGSGLLCAQRTPTPTASATRTPTPTPPSCVGACNGGDAVSVADVITMVSISLGAAPLSVCPAGDLDRSGNITVNEIVAAVFNALNGCATPTPTPTRTPTPQGLGQFCTGPADCGSGLFCTEGVCCNTDRCPQGTYCNNCFVPGVCVPPLGIPCPT